MKLADAKTSTYIKTFKFDVAGHVRISKYKIIFYTPN